MEIRTSYVNNLKTLNDVQKETEEFKKDITLNINNFKKLSYLYDREALARMLQNIIVTKKGTYPNNPDFGVGIENYMFELADGKTMSEMMTNINEQIARWISKNEDIDIQVDGQYLKSNNNQYVNLVLYFSVTRNPSLNIIGEDNSDIFTLFLTNDLKNRRIVSKLEL